MVLDEFYKCGLPPKIKFRFYKDKIGVVEIKAPSLYLPKMSRHIFLYQVFFSLQEDTRTDHAANKISWTLGCYLLDVM